MTKNDKIQWLIQHAPGPYARAKVEAMNELDDMTPVFCFAERCNRPPYVELQEISGATEDKNNQ